jgi:hypothetical protein
MKLQHKLIIVTIWLDLRKLTFKRDSTLSSANLLYLDKGGLKLKSRSFVTRNAVATGKLSKVCVPIEYYLSADLLCSKHEMTGICTSCNSNHQGQIILPVPGRAKTKKGYRT